MKTVKYLFFIICAVSFFGTSCIKDDAPALGDRGNAFLKFLEGPNNKLYFSPFSYVDSFNVFSLRREEASEAEMNTDVTLKLLNDTAAIRVYNDSNQTNYEVLPDSLYSQLNSAFVRNGEEYTVTIPAGVIGTEFNIALDGSKWDVSHKYAMYFKIIDSAGKRLRTTNSEVLVTIEAKNRWDGVYEVTGKMTDVTSSGLTHINDYLSANGEGNMQYELRTISPTECAVYDNYFFGGYYVPITSAQTDGSLGYSYYGSYSLIMKFDPETNEIVSVTNYYGQPASNTRSAELDPSGVNAYDPSSKTLEIKYRMLQPSVVTAPPYIRTTWDETWKYIGER